MARTKQITVRMNVGTIVRLDKFAAAIGTPRAALIRVLADDFAGKSEALLTVIQSSKGHAALAEWITQMLEDLEHEAQLALPVKGREP